MFWSIFTLEREDPGTANKRGKPFCASLLVRSLSDAIDPIFSGAYWRKTSSHLICKAKQFHAVESVAEVLRADYPLSFRCLDDKRSRCETRASSPLDRRWNILDCSIQGELTAPPKVTNEHVTVCVSYLIHSSCVFLQRDYLPDYFLARHSDSLESCCHCKKKLPVNQQMS